MGVGGIIGCSLNGNVTIEKCYNLGNIYSACTLATYGYYGVGGILGKNHNRKAIINYCYNTGKIEGNGCRVGGIAGSQATIYNSYNIGTIMKGAGISGFGGEIYNCYNWGNATLSGIEVSNYTTEVIIQNVYTTANVQNKPILNNAIAGTYNIQNAFYSENCAYSDSNGIKISEERMKLESGSEVKDGKALVTLLNEYVENYNSENSSNEDYVELYLWKIDDNTKYPVLEY